MSLTITISQGAKLSKQKPTLADLRKKFGASFNIGGVGAYFNFLPEPAAPPPGGDIHYMVYGLKGMLGRGFYLMISPDYNTFQLATQQPTTIHDLEDLVAFAGILAEMLAAKKLTVGEWGDIPTPELAGLFPEIRRKNCELLHKKALEQPGFMVSGVRFPLTVPPAVCARVAGLPSEKGELFFSGFLGEKQQRPYEYLAPHLQREEEGGPVVGHYTLQEDFATVIPKEPFLPFGVSPFGEEPVASWVITLVSTQGGVLGSLPYAAFREKLNERELTDFDARHEVLRALSRPRLLELLA